MYIGLSNQSIYYSTQSLLLSWYHELSFFSFLSFLSPSLHAPAASLPWPAPPPPPLPPLLLSSIPTLLLPSPGRSAPARPRRPTPPLPSSPRRRARAAELAAAARLAKEERARAAQAARDAAAARGADAEREAAVAQQERDTADARLQAALDRAAQEHAAAAPPLEDDAGPDDAEDFASADGDDPHLRAVLLQHEAAVLLNLHA